MFICNYAATFASNHCTSLVVVESIFNYWMYCTDFFPLVECTWPS